MWGSVGHVPDYVGDAVDIEKRGVEGAGWNVRTGCTRYKKHEGEKDVLKWEKMRYGVSGTMGWLRAGRQSYVGDEICVVTSDM